MRLIQTNTIAKETLETFKPTFYLNTKRNNVGYENEPSLMIKINIWFKEILNKMPLTMTSKTGRKFPGYNEDIVIMTFRKYSDIFKLFLNTPNYRVNIQYFKDCIRYIDNGGTFSDINIEDNDENIDYDDEMEKASLELLKNDNIFGYNDY